VRVSNSPVRVLALKKAEDSDEIVLRVVELNGKQAPDVHVSFAAQLGRRAKSMRRRNQLGQPN
jgi:alpha-mannosidase